MCGLVFTVNLNTYATRLDDMFSDALLASQVRGLHSTGVFQLAPDRKMSMAKRALTASEFLDTQEVRPIITAVPRSLVTVGHVRHATVGLKTDENAHPFVIARDDGSSLVGVHNGTLTGWRGKAGSDDHDVDSEWAFKTLAEHGVDAFKSFNGAFAFIWFDSNEPDVLHFARNDQRPLFYMVSQDRKTLFGASELGMLGWIAERNKFDPAIGKHKNPFYYFKPSQKYTLNLRTLEMRDEGPLPDYDPKTTVTPTYTRSTSYSMVPWRDWEDDGYRYSNYDSRGYRSTTPGYSDPRQQQVLELTKAALRKARLELTAPVETTSETSEVEAEISRLINDNKSDGVQTDSLFCSDPDASSATFGEKKDAREFQIYGRIVEFSGIAYNSVEETCQGIIIDSDGLWGIEEGEIRGLTRRQAHELYINPSKSKKLAVVGYFEQKTGNECIPVVVLSELPTKTKNLLTLQKRTQASDLH